MRIERHAPLVRRGVTQLMYVGDDDAVDRVVSGRKAATLVAGGLLAMVLGRGVVRVAGGIAAVVGAMGFTD